MDSQHFYKMLDEVKEKEFAREEKARQEELERKERQRQEMIKCITNKDNWSYNLYTKEFTLYLIDCKYSWDATLCDLLEEYFNKKVYWFGDKPKDGHDYVLLYTNGDNDDKVYVSFIE